jgi:hypothetical protein
MQNTLAEETDAGRGGGGSHRGRTRLHAETYCGVAPRGRSIERPLLINGYAYLTISLQDNGQVDNNS